MSVTLTKKDFESSTPVRWCPGCGDYGILAAVQKVLPELEIPKEKIVFISGIGCSSRFPYYMNTYGFHTIHGRALPIATGIKLNRPDMSVWVITGDGDALSIGGNHFIHTMRRNPNLNILLFNNEIYGLTKGQFSPTSQLGLVTKSSPHGTVDKPFNPLNLAIGAGASFVARTYDKNQTHMKDVFLRAAKHSGTSIIEILQNCVIFNDKVHDPIYGKEVREEHMIDIQEGKPLIFGNNSDKAIIFEEGNPKVVHLKDYDASKLPPFYAEKTSEGIAYQLGKMDPNHGFPVAVGIIRAKIRPTLEENYIQLEEKIRKEKKQSLTDILHYGETWEVK